MDTLGEGTTLQDSYKANDYESHKDSCMFRVNEKMRIRWDLFVMILAFWNCYSLPFAVAFEPEIFEASYFVVLNSLSDFCFFVDIIINFRTTIVNPRTGDEISSPRLIALEYLKGRFWIDFVATVPFDYIFLGIVDTKTASTLRLFSMLKLLRVLRLGRIITYMNTTDDIKLSLKLLKMFFFLVMYIHGLACFWFYIVSLDEEWVPPFNLVYNEYSLYEAGLLTQYWASFYHAVLLLCGNDVYPRGNTQVALAAIFNICGALINANIFGNIAVLVSAINRKASRFQEQIDIANTAMKNMKLPEDIQRKVQDYLMYTQSTLDNQKELDMFLNMISPSLRLEVTQHIFMNAIENNDNFKGNSQLVDFVVHNITPLLYLPEDNIVRQG